MIALVQVFARRWFGHQQNTIASGPQMANGVQSEPKLGRDYMVNSNGPIALWNLPETNKANPPDAIGQAVSRGGVNKYHGGVCARDGADRANGAWNGLDGFHGIVRHGVPFQRNKVTGEFEPIIPAKSKAHVAAAAWTIAFIACLSLWTALILWVL